MVVVWVLALLQPMWLGAAAASGGGVGLGQAGGVGGAVVFGGVGGGAGGVGGASASGSGGGVDCGCCCASGCPLSALGACGCGCAVDSGGGGGGDTPAAPGRGFERVGVLGGVVDEGPGFVFGGASAGCGAVRGVGRVFAGFGVALASERCALMCEWRT